MAQLLKNWLARTATRAHSRQRRVESRNCRSYAGEAIPTNSTTEALAGGCLEPGAKLHTGERVGNLAGRGKKNGGSG